MDDPAPGRGSVPVGTVRRRFRHATRAQWTLALAAGVVAFAGGTIGGGGWPGLFVDAVARSLLSVIPNEPLAWGIVTLGDLGRPLLAIAAGAIGVLALSTSALFVLFIAEIRERTLPEAALGSGFAQALVAYVLVTDPAVAVGAGISGAVAIAFVGTGGVGSASIPGRRRALRAVALAAGSVGVAWATGRRPSPVRDDAIDDPIVEAMLDVAADRSFDLPGAEPLVSERFFTVDINTSTPIVYRDDWELAIEGVSGSVTTYDFDSLTARDAEHRFITLRCVSDEINGDLMDTALWTGVPIKPLLEEAGAPEECCVYVEAVDGYYHAFPLAALERGFLSWKMNGRPLPPVHGHPVRALIPGHWGEINVKWITRIEIRSEPATSYWAQHGWHGDGPVSTVAKIHSVAAGDDESDGGIVVGGHAYAGTRGIRGVEVSVDGGERWANAMLSVPLPGATPANGDVEGDPGSVEGDGERQESGWISAEPAADAWRMWRYAYDAEDAHEVVVRAVEADGAIQPDEESDPYPAGASGWVRRRVDPDHL